MSLTHDELTLSPDAYSSTGNINPRATVTWTRVYLRGGHYAHLWEAVAYTGCGEEADTDPDLRDDWLGTGSQEEYETAERKRLCPKCFRHREVASIRDERLGTGHGVVMA